MPSYMGWPVVVMPSSPPAPQSIEPAIVNLVAQNVSPFEGQMQVYDWSARFTEILVSMPPMPYSVFQNWIAFLQALDGSANVFQFTSAFQAAYPNDIGSGVYYRMKSNTLKWSVQRGRIYYLSFEVRQAI